MININSLRIIDLFAGCGGMSLGFANAKLNIIGAVDNWKPAINVYRKNFTHPIHNLDIGDKANWEFIRKTKCNFITGGSPYNNNNFIFYNLEKKQQLGLSSW